MDHTNQTRTDFGGHVFIFKAMFYLLSPEETFYKNTEDVPDLIQGVTVLTSIYLYCKYLFGTAWDYS